MHSPLNVCRILAIAAASLCAAPVTGQNTKEQKRPAPPSRPASPPPRTQPQPAPRQIPQPTRTGSALPGGAYHPGPTPGTSPAPYAARGYAPATPSAAPGYGRPAAAPSTPARAPAYGSRPGPAYTGGSSRPAPRPPVTSTTLPPSGSGVAVNRLNANRTTMGGFNRRPIPPGTVTQRSDGTSVVQASGGREFHLRPNGSLSSVSLQGGQRAAFHPDGRIAAFHSQNVDVTHGLRGSRTVVFTRPDHTVVVSHGLHSGYVQREVVFNGHPYLQRTVLIGGQRYERAYTGYSFHGVVLQSYVPHYRYSPAFYGWAYYPWATPVGYQWTGAGTPAFGAYFAPAPTYAAPYDWLADYYVGQTLSDAYASGQADGAAQQASFDGQSAQPGYGPPPPQQGYADPNGQPFPDGDQGAYADPNTAPPEAELAAPTDTPVSPEIRQTLSTQVQQQIAYENAASAAPQPEDGSRLDDLPQVLQPNHIFVVSTTLNTSTPQQMTCNLSAGDTVQLAETPAPDATTADLVVASSRRYDCPAGVHVALTLDHLEEMQNAFRAHLDDGLKTLHDQQGKGLPAAPASAIAAPPRPVEYPPSSSEDVSRAITAANQQGSQAESAVTLAAFSLSQNQH